MLGIDITENLIRVVKLKRKRGKLLVAGAFTLECENIFAQGSITAIGNTLFTHLSKNGWLKNEAVACIPHKPCFIKRMMVPAIESNSARAVLDKIKEQAGSSMLGSPQNMIYDIRYPETDIKKCKFVTVASANKNYVNIARRLAEHCNLKLKAIDVRSSSAINGMAMLWQECTEETFAVIFKSSSRIYISIHDRKGIVSTQSYPCSSDNNSTKDSDSIIRIFNTMKLKQSNVPSPRRIFLAGTLHSSQLNQWSETVAAVLNAALAIETSVCPPELGIIWPAEFSQPRLNYTSAIGAAFNGLKVTNSCFDFLHIKEKKNDDHKKGSLTTSLVFFGFLAIATLIFWMSVIGQKKMAIKYLETQIATAEPEKESVFSSQQSWLQCIQYIPANKGGNRLEYLKVLYELSKLMPATDKAYITNLIVFSDRVANGYNVKMTIKATEATLITDISESLNKSNLFRDVKQDGVRTHDEIDEFYPISFSITFNLNRPGTTPLLPREATKK